MFKQEIMELIHDADSATAFSVDGEHNMDEYDLNEIIPSLIHSDIILTPQDETQDVAFKYQNHQAPIFVPTSPIGPPIRTCFAGELNFQVEINGKHTNKKKYLYSHVLNRIYVDMDVDFPVQFSLESRGEPMYVRATVVFADESQAQKRVERCYQHRHADTGKEPSSIEKNVLRSARDLGTSGVYYCGESTIADSWYSVLSRVEGPGPVSQAYKFVCKSSCSTGINRRAVDLLFTLENRFGEVLGRQAVGARVCSCPRRDLHRDETSERPDGKRRLAKRPAPSEPDQPPTKVKVELHDDAPLELPPLQIMGRAAMETGLEVMAKMMEQEASHKRHNTPALEEYNKCIASVRSFIDHLKNK